jgi:hypothetical protein
MSLFRFISALRIVWDHNKSAIGNSLLDVHGRLMKARIVAYHVWLVTIIQNSLLHSNWLWFGNSDHGQVIWVSLFHLNIDSWFGTSLQNYSSLIGCWLLMTSAMPSSKRANTKVGCLLISLSKSSLCLVYYGWFLLLVCLQPWILKTNFGFIIGRFGSKCW